MANPGIEPRVNAWGIPVTRHHPLRGLYDQIIGRCHLRNYYAYDRYGGRGIRVCERWREPHGQGFWNFVLCSRSFSHIKHYRKLFKNKGDAIKQRRAWEYGEFEYNLIRKRG